MPDAYKILGALNVFVDQFGDDIDHYINFDQLLGSKAVIDEVRPIIERRISSDYRPGFKFEDDNHAVWFMKKYASWPTWVSNYPLDPKNWDETWTRMMMVPNRHHYIAEIAAGLQNYDQKTQRLIREFNEIRDRGDEQQTNKASLILNINRAGHGLPPGPLKGERNMMAMKSWPQRLQERFGDFQLPTHDTSIIRIANNASGFREERMALSVPSGWRVIQVTYHGEINNPDAKDKKKWDAFTKEYMEIWEWSPIDGIDPPLRTKLVFLEPAAPDLWARKWKKNKRPFRD